ncbi:hypothetical protein C882_0106 [Caenispirillum salinarum AK4]|uniref:DUF3179 domain-containing protein n=1 Tax=Caenispirillum salinarum AK4 TaxID=1238182 RepID=K9GVN1_9PROT|nr:DUF3179 domain-containing protein [Caenispirillum salinarum]EKV30025.1 hypothetical protein C882_0106 [Caenispirillum salinarum AK4]
MPVLLAVLLLVAALPLAAAEVPRAWEREFPATDFSNAAVPLDEIMSGGPPRDGIPSIDDPRFKPASAITDLSPREPVIGLTVNGETRAYPLRILHWHEIVNDTVGGVPVAVTYCPLCNAAIVFDRRVGDRVLEFGTTGKLRHSDLVMYDRQTETWWQQFTGEGIVGALTGTELDVLPSRLESWAEFQERAPADAPVLVPTDPAARDYGRNPYAGYDTAARPFLYSGETPGGVEPMMRVVALDDEAWTLPLVRERGRVETDGGHLITWRAGQASALDAARVAEGRDVGTVLVSRDGRDVPYDVTFAFVFFAFRPDGVLHTLDGVVRAEDGGGG